MDGHYIGTILPWPMNWAPKNFAMCNGMLLTIDPYKPLFSLLGTTFGGDGRVTFGLPDLRGRVPIGSGQSSVGDNYKLGDRGGSSGLQMRLPSNALPYHSHILSQVSGRTKESEVSLSFKASIDSGTGTAAKNNDYIGSTTKVSGKDVNLFRGDAVNYVNISGVSGKVPAQKVDVIGSISPTGDNEPFYIPIMQPYVVMNYIICINGLFPPREGSQEHTSTENKMVCKRTPRSRRRRRMRR